ncbi:anti-sigma factor RsbA family regulatory protein [Blastococcus xanthinilyticus]|uniref:Anti-sigma regulatory factor (Ser/Thr protein kinase) n=1 Tax=Blastococcus xanthinilyticus TaxID=1564164 RepID=A0A5S5D2Q6_9ACTN|nr:anti-sigma factor RsbA family regulatory protein [Blastococcus xanthinilyticus]TYP90313.1 anti-sigma regulatory factor (Ser/Thr protein kinase) [Blastococcus xanthinilyticus]
MDGTTTGGAGQPAPDEFPHQFPHEFPHEALLYDSTDELVAMAAPFLREGLERGEAAVVAARPDSAAALREALDDDPRLLVVDRHEVYRPRTPEAITTFRRLAARCTAAGAPRVRVLGEVDYGLTEREWLEWERYESVINVALSGWQLWGVCAFDTQRLPGPVVESAGRTHGWLATPDGHLPSPGFTDPASYLRALPVPDEPLERTPPLLAAADVADFIGLRHTVGAALATVAAPADLVEDFLLAVDEMTSNAVRHGVPPVGLRLWTAPDRIVCTISDGGPGWDDPFAGYGPAHGADLSRGGMGLWLARQLCDHVDISGGRHHPGDGGVGVRLTTLLP